MPANKSLRERCKALYQKLGTDAILRQHDPVDTIVEFVCAEVGRTASPQLDKALPLVFYAPTEQDRDDIIAAFRTAYPSAICRKV